VPTTKFDFGAVVGNTLVLLDVAPHYDRPVASLQGDYSGSEIAFNTPDCVATLRRA
jgi:hypothetical protein